MGIDCRGLFVCEDPSVSSGLAPITVDDNGENQIVIIGGANDELTKEEIMSLDSEGNVLGPNGAKWLVVQLELPVELSIEGMKIAKKNGMQVLVNTAPGRPISELNGDIFK